MTVAIQNPYQTYVSDGTTLTPYPWSFRTDRNTWLIVSYQVEGQDPVVLVENTDYTLAGGNPNDAIQFPNGGTLSFVAGRVPPNQSTIIIYRQTPAEQTTDYQDFGAFPAQTHENALDWTVMRDQEQNARIGGFIPIAGEGFVTSWNNRTGDVFPANGDYNADQITETAGRIFYTDPEKTKLAGIAPGATNTTTTGDLTDWNNAARGLNKIVYWNGTQNAYQDATVIKPTVESFMGGGLARPSVNEYFIHVTTEHVNTVSGLGSITNNANDGFIFEANQKVMVTICLNMIGDNGASTTGFSLNGTGTQSYNSEDQNKRFAITVNSSLPASATLVMSNTEKLSVHFNNKPTSTSASNSRLTMTVTAIN